ncbi:hypothetical protein DMP08_11550 [Paraeggerthella hongkongensis]|uniref:Uncharacterized protein n=1 Tax=Paraeggerthella hongkongensis TaxID=230658 RepID=A0A3N0AWD2_9ACTN|nr:hypothetical protein DMP08_11550 [Paraeggerthella hongkongensis]
MAAAGGLAAGAGPMVALAGSSATTAAAVLAASAAFAAATATALVLDKAVSAMPSGLKAASSSFGSLADSATGSVSKAEAAVRSGLRRIQSEVSGMRLQLPRIEVGALPHFTLSGSFSPETGSVPRVGVNWYGRGGVFSGASVIGVGERGPEAVVPLSSRRMEPFASAVADNMGGVTQADLYDAIVSAIESTRANEPVPVYLDGREVTDRLAPRFGARLGSIEGRRARGL